MSTSQGGSPGAVPRGTAVVAGVKAAAGMVTGTLQRLTRPLPRRRLAGGAAVAAALLAAGLWRRRGRQPRRGIS